MTLGCSSVRMAAANSPAACPMSSFSPRQFPAFEKIDDRAYDNGGRVADVVVGTAQSGLHVVLCAGWKGYRVVAHDLQYGRYEFGVAFGEIRYYYCPAPVGGLEPPGGQPLLLHVRTIRSSRAGCAVRFLRSGTGCGRGRYVRIVPSVVRVKYVAVPVAEDSLYGSGSDVYS